jgi:hypothetical protein
MPRGPAHAGAAPEPGDPVPAPDWMTEEDWLAWCEATAVLDDDEAQAAGEQVLGRAHRLTPGGLRHAIARAVMDVLRARAYLDLLLDKDSRPGPGR